MAVTLTIAQLARALRLHTDATTDPPDPIYSEVERVLQTATEIVTSETIDGTPDRLHNEGVIRVAGYLYSPPSTTDPGTPINIFRASGAQAFLHRYRQVAFGLTASSVAAAESDGPSYHTHALPPGGAVGDYATRGPEESVEWTTPPFDAADQAKLDGIEPGATAVTLPREADEVDSAGTGETPLLWSADRLVDLVDQHAGDAADALETGLRYDRGIALAATAVVGISDLPYQLSGNPHVPAIEPGARITWTVSRDGISAPQSQTVSYEAFTTLPTISSPATTLTDNNALRLYNAADAEDYFLAQGSDGHFRFGADSIDTYTVTITIDAIDLEDWARKSNSTAVVPKSKLPSDVSYGQSGGSNNQLTARAALPSISGFGVGDLIKVGHNLYELVADTEDTHILTGISAVHDTNYAGDGVYSWQYVSPYNQRLNLSKSAVGSSPPATIYGLLQVGNLSDYVVLVRASGSDTNTTYRYAHRPGSSGIERAIGPYRLSLYTSFAGGTLSGPLTVHDANRWELWDRAEKPTIPTLPAVVTDAEATAGTVTDPRLWPPSEVKRAVQALTPISSDRELLSGALTGIFVTAANANSAVALTNLTDPLDLDDEGHGLLAGEFTFTISNAAANTIGWNPVASGPNVTTSKSVPFIAALQAIRRTAAYSSTTSSFGLILASIDLYDGQTITGQVVVRAHRDAINNVALNAQYLTDAGVTSSRNCNVGITGEVIVEPTGVTRGGTSGTSGPLFEFADTLPTADETYADGDLALVYSGSARGLYRKSSSITHVAADTSLAGLDLDPSADLHLATLGRNSDQYFARAAFTPDRATSGSLPANTSWSDAPTVLSVLDFNYRTTTRTSGQIEFRFSSARSYTGVIRISAGATTIDVSRSTSTSWLRTGLTSPQIAALRENTWRLSEPGVTATTTTHAWNLMMGGQRPTTKSDQPTPTLGGREGSNFHPSAIIDLGPLPEQGPVLVTFRRAGANNNINNAGETITIDSAVVRSLGVFPTNTPLGDDVSTMLAYNIPIFGAGGGIRVGRSATNRLQMRVVRRDLGNNRIAPFTMWVT